VTVLTPAVQKWVDVHKLDWGAASKWLEHSEWQVHRAPEGSTHLNLPSIDGLVIPKQALATLNDDDLSKFETKTRSVPFQTYATLYRVDFTAHEARQVIGTLAALGAQPQRPEPSHSWPRTWKNLGVLRAWWRKFKRTHPRRIPISMLRRHYKAWWYLGAPWFTTVHVDTGPCVVDPHTKRIYLQQIPAPWTAYLLQEAIRAETPPDHNGSRLVIPSRGGGPDAD